MTTVQKRYTDLLEWFGDDRILESDKEFKAWLESVAYNSRKVNELFLELKELEAASKEAISRQAVLNTLDDMDKVLDVDRTVEEYKALLKECFENLTPVQPKAQTEWIPIKTRPLTEKEKEEMGTESPYMYDCPLPDDGEEVEITTHLGDVTMDIFCRESGGCYFENYCDDGDVLAWRHKPEPYKAESEEKT